MPQKDNAEGEAPSSIQGMHHNPARACPSEHNMWCRALPDKECQNQTWLSSKVQAYMAADILHGTAGDGASLLMKLTLVSFDAAK